MLPGNARSLDTGEAADALGEAPGEVDHRSLGVGSFNKIVFDVADAFGAEAGGLVGEAKEGLYEQRRAAPEAC